MNVLNKEDYNVCETCGYSSNPQKEKTCLYCKSKLKIKTKDFKLTETDKRLIYNILESNSIYESDVVSIEESGDLTIIIGHSWWLTNTQINMFLKETKYNNIALQSSHKGLKILLWN